MHRLLSSAARTGLAVLLSAPLAACPNSTDAPVEGTEESPARQMEAETAEAQAEADEGVRSEPSVEDGTPPAPADPEQRAEGPPGVDDGGIELVDRTSPAPFDGSADARVGRWVGQADLTAEANADESLAAMADRLLQNATLVLTIGDDGSLQLENRFATHTVLREGTHEVTSVEGDVIHLQTVLQAESGAREEPATLTFLDQDALVMRTGSDQAALAFVRAANVEPTEMAAPPFAPDALQAFIQVGMRWTFQHQRGGDSWRTNTDVVAVSDDGPTFEFMEFADDGAPRGTLRTSDTTWVELASHATYRESSLTVEEATDTFEGTTYEGWIYRVQQPDGSTVESFFGRDVPGPPLRWTVSRDGEIEQQNTLIVFNAAANVAAREAGDDVTAP